MVRVYITRKTLFDTYCAYYGHKYVVLHKNVWDILKNYDDTATRISGKVCYSPTEEPKIIVPRTVWMKAALSYNKLKFGQKHNESFIITHDFDKVFGIKIKPYVHKYPTGFGPHL